MNRFQTAYALGTLLLTLGAVAAPASAQSQTTMNAACAREDVDAKLLTAIPADWPSTLLQPATGIAAVEVNLNEDGLATSASIFRSTGNPELDRSAVSDVLVQTYQPQITQCVKTGGSYLVEVEFTD